jgi:phospholipase C
MYLRDTCVCRCSNSTFVRAALVVLCVVVAGAVAQQRKFDHIIMVMEENRSFDHLLGWSKQLGIDGLTGRESNPVSTVIANSPRVFVDAEAPYIARVDPDHTTYATTSKIYGMRQLEAGNFTETMQGFVEWQHFLGNENNTKYGGVMSMFSPARLPVMNQLAAEFTVMDRFFASVPGCTWPNRQFAMAGTSGGNTETYFWYQGIPGQLFPHRTIFDQLSEEGLSWKNYYTDTPWETFMESLAHHPDNLQPMKRFYEDAAAGTLPSYGFINPRSGINMTTYEGSNDMHPDHDVALGEQFYKDIYEAVRASPAWNRTLLIITFDEHGGFYDHVTPPSENIPAPDDSAAFPDVYFKFDRLGLRIPTLLISAWNPKGSVINRPPAAQMPANNSEYDLTSIPATIRKLFNMSAGPLTRRDAWAATFEHIFSEATPRTDCPEKLVPAPPPTRDDGDLEEDREISHLQRDIATMLHQLTGEGHRDEELAMLPTDIRQLPSALQRQGELSQWLLGRFEHHQHKTRQWKAHKSGGASALPYKVVVDTYLSPVWMFGDLTWDLNNGTNCSYITITTRALRDNATGVPYCLTHNTTAPAGEAITVVPCYPTASPCYNRDPQQRWVYNGGDSSIRPYDSQEMCFTTNYNFGEKTPYFAACNQSVTQAWAYMGRGAGMGNIGTLFFGCGVANIGAVLNL